MDDESRDKNRERRRLREKRQRWIEDESKRAIQRSIHKGARDRAERARLELNGHVQVAVSVAINTASTVGLDQPDTSMVESAKAAREMQTQAMILKHAARDLGDSKMEQEITALESSISHDALNPIQLQTHLASLQAKALELETRASMAGAP